MKITINPYDKESIRAAITAVEQYKREFLEKQKEFTRRLGEIGVRVAQAGFALADYDGENDVTVSLEETKNGYSVIASGRTVGFIEFGSGVKYRPYNSDGLDYTPPERGSYGKGQGKNPKGWYFSPHPGSIQHSYGSPPAEAMLEARNSMIENVVRIAREVWGE